MRHHENSTTADDRLDITGMAMLSVLAEEIAERLFDASRVLLPANSVGARERWAELPQIDRANYRRRAERAIIEVEAGPVCRLAKARTTANVAGLLRDAFPDHDVPGEAIIEAVEQTLLQYPIELGLAYAMHTRPPAPKGVAGKCEACGDVLWREKDGSAACLNCGFTKEAK